MPRDWQQNRRSQRFDSTEFQKVDSCQPAQPFAGRESVPACTAARTVKRPMVEEIAITGVSRTYERAGKGKEGRLILLIAKHISHRRLFHVPTPPVPSFEINRNSYFFNQRPFSGARARYVGASCGCRVFRERLAARCRASVPCCRGALPAAEQFAARSDLLRPPDAFCLTRPSEHSSCVSCAIICTGTRCPAGFDVSGAALGAPIPSICPEERKRPL